MNYIFRGKTQLHSAPEKMTDVTLSLRTEIVRFLAEFAGQRVLFVPNEGNVGDCLIFAATLDAMAKASIEVEIVGNDADFGDRIVFLGGGGNLIDMYRGMRQTFEACGAKAKRIILLPHTIRGNADLIRSLDHRATIWCRDERSLEHVCGLNSALDCRLGHDMAFHCDVANFLSDMEWNDRGPSMLEAGLDQHGTSLNRISRLPVVRFMRTDREARTPGNATDLDVSRAFGQVADPRTSRLAAWCFLKTISAAQRVVTDRLHVAIACALLEKECELLDNSYNKNREIYAHSLRRFQWLTFTKSAGKRIADQPPPKKSLLARVRRHARRMARERLWSSATQ